MVECGYDSRSHIDRPDLILLHSPTLFSFGVISQLDKQWRSTASGHVHHHFDRHGRKSSTYT